MKILCIQDGHNASASLMINGKIIFALQEERFNEIKNYTGYPYQSVQYCLNFLKKEKLNLDLAGIASTFKNPYGDKSPVVYTGRNSSKDFNGRMRFDETECSGGSSKKQIALWVKTHKDEDYKPTLISMDEWCN